jgi:hypothetical protein
MIKDVYDAIVECRYDVSIRPQEKRPDRQMVLRLDDVNIDVSDSHLYEFPVILAIEWNDDAKNVLEIPDFIKKFMQDIEGYFYEHSTGNRATFRWIGTTVTSSGTQYNIILKCMYKEEIQID